MRNFRHKHQGKIRGRYRIRQAGYLQHIPHNDYGARGILSYDKGQSRELLKRFDTTEKADAALAELKEYWNNL